MSEADVDTVRRATLAFSEGDADAFIALASSDLEWKVGLSAVEGEVFRGHEGARTYFNRLRTAWSDFQFLAEEFRDLGEVVVVLGRLRGSGRSGGVPIESPVGAVWELRDGKVRRLRAYLDQGEALRAAGVEPAPPRA